MSKRWLTTSKLGTGRYGITRGLYKRFWDASSKISAIIVPQANAPMPVPPTGSGYLLTQSGDTLKTEDGEFLVV
jgi:hypothetical protein